jgi:hypothetical protein
MRLRDNVALGFFMLAAALSAEPRLTFHVAGSERDPGRNC